MTTTPAVEIESRLDFGTAEKVLIVSNDSHVSPPLEQFRSYCPKAYLQDLDDYARAFNALQDEERLLAAAAKGAPDGLIESMQALRDQTLIHYDPHEAIRHMDEDGVAVEVLFHGAMNGNPLPFLGNVGFGAGKPFADGVRGFELAAAGMRMYNRWLADYCSVEPGRHIGLAQFPMWDVDLAVAEIEFARAAGLGGLNFPAPRPSIPDYNEYLWDPVWSAAESLDMPLNTHGASSPALLDVATYTGIDGTLCLAYDFILFSRRGLPFMVFGGVFERHPSLKLVFTEQPSAWVETTLEDLDELWAWSRYQSTLPRKPSEYFWENCYVGVSFMSNTEARTAVAQGSTGNLLWGRDYPHIEGTWPYTRLSLRKALEGIPPNAARDMLGLNAAKVYGLRECDLRPIIDRIGPTMEEITAPLTSDELPEGAQWTMAFREGSSWA